MREREKKEREERENRSYSGKEEHQSYPRPNIADVLVAALIHLHWLLHWLLRADSSAGVGCPFISVGVGCPVIPTGGSTSRRRGKRR